MAALSNKETQTGYRSGTIFRKWDWRCTDLKYDTASKVTHGLWRSGKCAQEARKTRIVGLILSGIGEENELYFNKI
jgi:hypothetical protein